MSSTRIRAYLLCTLLFAISFSTRNAMALIWGDTNSFGYSETRHNPFQQDASFIGNSRDQANNLLSMDLSGIGIIEAATVQLFLINR
jgi:hypothetical protein